MLTWKRTKRPLGDLKRPKKSRRRLFWTILGPKSKSRGAQERPKIGPKRKKASANIGKIVFSKTKIYYNSPDIVLFLGSMMAVALLDAKKRFLIDLPTSSTTCIFWSLSQINNNGVAVRLVRLLAALGAQKSKKWPQDGPTKRHSWTLKRSKRNIFTIVIQTQNIL
jgi:hypothetical protein